MADDFSSSKSKKKKAVHFGKETEDEEKTDKAVAAPAAATAAAAAPAGTAVGGAGTASAKSATAPAAEEEVLAPLAKQDLAKLDVRALTPLTPEVISRQATINIGTIGHVAHGKSTIVKAISGVKTVRFKSELVRNITIKLGYANAKIYRSSGAPPHVYDSRGSHYPDEYPLGDGSGRTMQLVRHVSFVDCPGHDILMATMLNGAAVMDAALLLIAGNEPCPQPQTSEHLAAVEIMQLRNIIILQNKIDLVKEEAARAQYDQIREFIDGTVAGDAPIIPVSAQLRYNIDYLCQHIATRIPIPVRDFTSSPRLIVIRSFDVNKPGEEARTLKGGVAGGSILRGVLRKGDDIEIRPGTLGRDSEGNVRCTPIVSKILSLYAEKNDLEYAVPGGLIGVGTQLDPTLTRADRLVGQVLGHRAALPDVFVDIQVEYYLLKRLLGVKTDDGTRGARVSKLKAGEVLMVNIGSTSTGGNVVTVDSDKTATLTLTQPVCTQEGEKIALSRRVEGHWRLIGWGTIAKGSKITLSSRGPPPSAAAATAAAGSA